MFLLILFSDDNTFIEEYTLNSIMFLLIHDEDEEERRSLNNFKFHYVSINSD